MAAQRLAELVDFYKFGLKEDQVEGISTTDIEAHLDAASELFVSHLGKQAYTFPLISWGDDVRQCVCRIAAWSVLVTLRGLDPEAEGHKAIFHLYELAMQWLKDVKAGDLNLSIVSTSPARAPHRVIVAIGPVASDGSTDRGW